MSSSCPSPEPMKSSGAPGCAAVKRMLSGFHRRCSLPAFVIYGLVFQVHELQSAPLTVMGPPGPITVSVGADVVLPCRYSGVQTVREMDVIWFREHMLPSVHRYKGGQDQYGDQMLQYRGRTELLKDGLNKGHADLKIFNVQLPDRGSYTCFVDIDLDYGEVAMELQVTDPFFQNTRPWMTALGVVLVAVVALLIVAVYLFKVKGKQGKKIAMQEAALRDRDADIEKQAQELAWRRYALPINAVTVVLDSDTAHCNLVLSEDCTSVYRKDELQDIPDTSERFKIWCCVLGCEGFSSGSYYWQVEAVNGGGWLVGVCSEDVNKKDEIEFKPEEGIWAVGQWGGHFQALTSPNRTPFPEIQTPKQIRVSLDYEEGRVAFFSVDEKIPVFTFPLASFEKKRVYPWFWLGPNTCLTMVPC